MERLTFVDEDGRVLFDNPSGFPEDVGFTIRELAENEEWETLDNIAQRLANCEQRLKYHKDLEEQGKLLKLPCAVGDTVYTVCSWGIESGVVGSFEIISDRIFVNNVQGQMIGEARNVFLTKPEAEAKLAEMEGKNGD